MPSEAGRIPNNAEGFGRVDMRATVGPFASGTQLVLKDEGTALDSGEEEKPIIALPRRGIDLKVTLVWTDPPGEALQNDLDLIVRQQTARSGMARWRLIQGNLTALTTLSSLSGTIFP